MKRDEDRYTLEKQMIRPEVEALIKQLPDKQTDKSAADSRLIMLMVLREHIINSIFWNMLIDMLESEVKRHGFQFALRVVDEEEVAEPYDADGYILLGNLPQKYILNVSSANKPIVWVDGQSRYNSFSQVRVNNCYGAYHMSKKAIELGHKRLAFVRTSQHLSYIERYQGMLDCVAQFHEQGVKCELVQIGQDRAEDSLTQLLSRNDRPTFIITCTDSLAYTVYTVAEKLLIKIPRELSVAGFDNLQDSRMISPALSSVDVPRVDMAIVTVELLTKEMNNPFCPHELIEMEPTLVIRDSMAPAL